MRFGSLYVLLSAEKLQMSENLDATESLRQHYMVYAKVQRRFNLRRHRRAVQQVWGGRHVPSALRSAASFPDLTRYLGLMGEDVAVWISDALGRSTSLPVYLWQLSDGGSRRQVQDQLREPAPRHDRAYLRLGLAEAEQQLEPVMLNRRAWYALRTSEDTEVRLHALGILCSLARRRGSIPSAAALGLEALQYLPQVSPTAVGRFLQRLHYLPLYRLELEIALEICHRARKCHARAEAMSLVGRTWVDEAQIHLLQGGAELVASCVSVAEALLAEEEWRHLLSIRELRLNLALEEGDFEVVRRNLTNYESAIENMVSPPTRSLYRMVAQLARARLELGVGLHRRAHELFFELVKSRKAPDVTFRVQNLLHLGATSLLLRDENRYRLACLGLSDIATSMPKGPPPFYYSLLAEHQAKMKTKSALEERAASFLKLAARLRRPRAVF